MGAGKRGGGAGGDLHRLGEGVEGRGVKGQGDRGWERWGGGRREGQGRVGSRAGREGG